ncbi:MAG: DUF1289 domain-containing protein [Pseudomonadota bacterium]
MQFSPCLGGNNCTQDGSHCNGCGRSHEEIAKTRDLSNALAEHIVAMDYDNVEEFLKFVAIKAHGKAHMMKMGG